MQARLFAVACSAFLLGLTACPQRTICTPSTVKTDPFGAVGERTTLQVPLPFSGVCEQGLVKKAVVTITDFNADKVPTEVTFEPGAEDAPHLSVASVSFTPMMVGTYDVTVQFEPSWGTARLQFFAAERGDSTRLELPESPGFPSAPRFLCRDLQQTTSGIWFCERFAFAFDGGISLGDKVRVSGDSVWATDDHGVSHFDASDGGLTLTARMERDGGRSSLVATQDELWALMSGPPGRVEHVWRSDAGELAAEELRVAEVRSPSLLRGADAGILVASSSSSLKADGGTAFSLCRVGREASQLDAGCEEVPGMLVGADSNGLHVMTVPARTSAAAAAGELVFIAENPFEAGPRIQLLRGAGYLQISAPDLAARAIPMFGTVNLTATTALWDSPSVVLPRFVSGKGYFLEHFQTGGLDLEGANARFIWGVDRKLQKRFVLRRQP